MVLLSPGETRHRRCLCAGPMPVWQSQGLGVLTPAPCAVLCCLERRLSASIMLNCSNFNQLVGCSEMQLTHDVRGAMWQLPGRGQHENGSAQVGKGQQDPGSHCSPQQDPCVVMFAKASPFSMPLAGIPPLRRELDLLLPSSCSQSPVGCVEFLDVALQHQHPVPEAVPRAGEASWVQWGLGLSVLRATERPGQLLGTCIIPADILARDQEAPAGAHPSQGTGEAAQGLL